MNDNERDGRVEEVESQKQEVRTSSKDEVRKTLMKTGNGSVQELGQWSFGKNV